MKRTLAMNAHPAAAIFPLMDGAEFVALKDDIARNGQREPVWMFAGQILDGRNRWRACEELNIPCDSITYDGNDPVGFVVSLNLHRRHLTESQRAMVAAKLANLPAHRPAANSANLPTSMSQPEAASMLNVGERSLRSARHVMDSAPALVPAVQAAMLKVAAAEQIARHAPDAIERIAEAASRNDGAAVRSEVAGVMARIRDSGEVPHGRPSLAAPAFVRMNDTDKALQIKAIISELAAIAVPPEVLIANLPMSSWTRARAEIADAIEYLTALKEALNVEEVSH